MDVVVELISRDSTIVCSFWMDFGLFIVQKGIIDENMGSLHSPLTMVLIVDFSFSIFGYFDT